MRTARWVGACISGSLGDARPALRFREMTIEGYCHVGLGNPERDLALALIFLIQFDN